MPYRPVEQKPPMPRTSLARQLTICTLIALILQIAASTAGALALQVDPDAVETPHDTEARQAEAPLTWGVIPSSAKGPDGRSAFEYVFDPGSTLTDHVGVTNYTEAPLTLRVYANDAFTTVQGGFDLLAADQESVDVGTWVTFGEDTVTIPARSRVDLPFRIEVPRNATPGDHTGGIVATLGSLTTDDDGNQLAVDRRVGARIYVRVTGEMDPRLDMADLDVAYWRGVVDVPHGTVDVSFVAINSGNVRTVGRPVVRVEGPFGWGGVTFDGEELPEILPGSSVPVSFEVPGVLPLGRLSVDVSIDAVATSDGPLEGKLASPQPFSLWAVPWVPLGVLVAGIVTGWWWRRRRSSAAATSSSSRPVDDRGDSAAGSVSALAEHVSAGESAPE